MGEMDILSYLIGYEVSLQGELDLSYTTKKNINRDL